MEFLDEIKDELRKSRNRLQEAKECNLGNADVCKQLDLATDLVDSARQLIIGAQIIQLRNPKGKKK